MELPVTPQGVGPVCLVTGGNGYVGKHLVRRLLELGCEVRALDLAPFEGDSRVTSVVGDIQRLSDLRPACEGVDTVFHTAAIINTLTLARPSVRRQVYGVNVGGTENVIRACQAGAVKRLVFTSSITVAVDRPVRGADETAPYVGADGLADLDSQTKSRAEKMVLEAHDKDGLLYRRGAPGRRMGAGERRHDGARFPRAPRGRRFQGDDRQRRVRHRQRTRRLGRRRALPRCTEAQRRSGFSSEAKRTSSSDDQPTNPVLWYRPIVEGLGYAWPKVRVPRPLAYAIAYLGEVAHYFGGPFPR